MKTTRARNTMNRPAPASADAAATPGRRERVRAAAGRAGILAEVVLVGAGAWGLWAAASAGQTPSRPAQIAFWAGLVALVASLAAPRIKARVQRRRASR